MNTFPNPLYLDFAATTPVLPAIAGKLAAQMTHDFGNPSSGHPLGARADEIVNGCRKKLANFLNCSPSSVVFTSGATESNNWALEAGLKAGRRIGNTMLISRGSHPSVWEKAQALGLAGAKIVPVGLLENGTTDADHLFKELSKETIFCSLLWVNNETGVVDNIPHLAGAIKARAPHCRIHVDAAQAFGKIPDVSMAAPLDFLTLNAHKIFGPKGIGALILGKNARVDPLFIGGGQENKLRGGTENVTGILGMALAAEWMIQNRESHGASVLKLQETFEAYVQKCVPGSVINGGSAPRSPYTSNIAFPGLPGEVLVTAAAEKGLIFSTGAACDSRKKKYSRVLTSMGLAEKRLMGSVRISYSPTIPLDQIRKAAEVLCSTASALKEDVGIT